MIPADSPPPRMYVYRYAADGLEESAPDSAADLAGLRQREGKVWLDVQGLGDEATLRAIADLFGLHPLTLEDVVHVGQRPKFEPHDDHDFVVVRMLDSGAQQLELEQVSVLVGPDFVLTFQERPGDTLEPVRERLRKARGPIRTLQPCYLAYALVDTIIDGYYPVLDRLGTRLEDLEDRILECPEQKQLSELSDLRSDLLLIRRVLTPTRELLSTWTKSASTRLNDETRVFLRDTYDHCIALSDSLEAQRETASGLLSVYLTLVANKTNDVMRVLTVIASIFIPLTFIAGVYGMNFQNMPELELPWAYPAVWALMIGLGLGLLILFKRRGWLG